MAFLELSGLTRRFESVPAVDGVCLSVEQGEFFTLLGPSGCGKTTLLRMIAGLEAADEGKILLEGASLSALPPERRPLHTVFQSYALFPHLTVARNVAFPLEMARVGAAERERRVEEALSRVRLSGFGGRYPRQLSGGQSQRVALARALVNRPKLLLLDEPLAALDLKLREEMQRELLALQREVGITFVYVTHDQGEALALSDRIAVMEGGRIVQVGHPRSVYEKPANRFVAGFIGSCNLLPASVEAADERALRLAVPGLGTVLAAAETSLQAGCRGIVALRPERVHLDRAAGPNGAENRFPGVLCDRLYLGDTTVYRVRVGQGLLLEASLSNSSEARALGSNTPVEVSWRADDGRFLPEG